MTITLTGIQPTGDLHLGNYAGAIRPLAQLAAEPARETYAFIADLHALNGRPDPERLRDRTRRMAAALLACGLDHERVHLYRQSRVPAIAQITALLANVTSKGTLNRAHAYKAAVAANAAAGREPDHGVNAGLFTYPVLMAADILAMRADEVPVGADQAQHVEIAVELARAFTRAYRPLREPRLVAHDGGMLPGLDGRKMSKSYGNVIPVFAGEKELRKLIMKIKTNSLEPGQPKDPSDSALFEIYRAFATDEETAAVRKRYAEGIGWGDMKQLLFERINAEIAPARAEYERLMASPRDVEDVLRLGAEKARAVSRPFLAEIRDKVGIRALAR
jgi:tryptophanyl-tRNA synthetase